MFPPETHTCVKRLIISQEIHFIVLFFILIVAIIIIIGLIKYLVWFIPTKLSIHVGKQNDIDHLESQSYRLFIIKTNSNFWTRLPNAQRMKFSIKDFFSKCDQICRFLRIWPHLLHKSLIENFIFCAVSLIAFMVKTV